MKFLLPVLILSVIQSLTAQDCLSRDYGNNGTVCVCNANHCDTFKSIEKVKESLFIKVTSNEEGLRFQKEEGEFSHNSAAKNVMEIGTETYQEIFGFGGAFTDATIINIKSLSADLQETLFRLYFSDEGLEYNIGRVPIAGTDFSLRPYTYCDTHNDTADPELKNFSLQSEDYELKIPFIKKALQLRNNSLELFAAAWMAPNWMRTIPEFEAKKSFIKDEHYQSWADYHLKFLDAYAENNISFWGISTGNEPLTDFLPGKVPSVGWTPEGMRNWIKHNLGPTIRNSSHSGIKIFTIDDQRILFPWMVNMLFLDEEVKNYVDGMGVHWYFDALVPADLLSLTHLEHPDKFILATESCSGFLKEGVILGKWANAENVADHILQDLNHWVIGWADWNMALNVDGGPTFIDNLVDSPIIVNATAEEFYKQPLYYALGHFSKFLVKGSVRVKLSTFDDHVPAAAFKRPDGGTAVIILNKENKDISATVRDQSRGDITLNLTPKSITSIVYW